ncbi:AraC family transcriptional regulator [Actinomadura sp. 6N118]|uniref:AraC family transcriptional regulator n=1 Tax=Actinomadura sp. 6N118 TaxID=3375151 RepID=UPI00379496DF
MDILSDVICALRTGRPGGARVDWYAPWARRFPDQPGTAGILVVLQGSSWLIDESAEPVQLGPGDILFSPHGSGYAMADDPATPLAACREATTEEADSQPTATNPATVTLCGGYELDPSWTHPLLRELPDVIHVPARRGRHPELRAAVDILGAEMESPHLGADALIPIVLDMLLLYILRSWFEEHPRRATTTGWAAALADDAVSTALNAIHNEPARPWTVQELADEARLSRAAFFRRFGALTGQPPLAYLTWWRMTIAAGMLRDSASSIDTVASRVGYTSESAFANAFKRHFGIAPGKFRRQP